MTSRMLVFLSAATCLVVAGCADSTPADPPSQYITAKRAWAPGERAAFLSSVAANHSLSVPLAGDLSDLAPQLYADPDSVVVLVPNPLFHASLSGPLGVGPSLSLTGAMFAANWTVVGAKLRIVNNDPFNPGLPDTTYWYMTIWSDPNDATDHGFAIVGSDNPTFNVTPLDNVAWFNANGKSGAAAGEYHTSTTTLWLDDQANGRFQGSGESFTGTYATIASGPYVGGRSRSGTLKGRVSSAVLVRSSGTDTPTSFTVDIDYRGSTPITGVDIICNYDAVLKCQ